MSVVVAIKEHQNVWMAADSQTTRGGSRRSYLNPNNYKIWHPNGHKNVLIGAAGYVREINLMKVSQEINDLLNIEHFEITFGHIINKLIPKMFEVFDNAKILSKSENPQELNCSYIIVAKELLFYVGKDASVIEIDDFITIGSGTYEAIGSVLSTPNKNIKTRLIYAIKSSATSDIYVDYPIIIGNNQTIDYEVIHK